jgi:hypothetical protein
LRLSLVILASQCLGGASLPGPAEICSNEKGPRRRHFILSWSLVSRRPRDLLVQALILRRDVEAFRIHLLEMKGGFKCRITDV